MDGVETRFVVSGGLVLQELNDPNSDDVYTVTRSYVWDGVSPGGIGGLLELTTDGQHYDYLYDGKGNVSAVLDGSQGVVASYKYDPFGVLVSETGTLDQPFRFSTKYYYPSFGGDNHGVRFYIANLGRWLTRDPIGEEGGVNLYEMVGNSPMNRVDPYGLLGYDSVLKFILKQIGKKIGGKAGDKITGDGKIAKDPSENDEDNDGVPDFQDPDSNKCITKNECWRCHETKDNCGDCHPKTR